MFLVLSMEEAIMVLTVVSSVRFPAVFELFVSSKALGAPQTSVNLGHLAKAHDDFSC